MLLSIGHHSMTKNLSNFIIIIQVLFFTFFGKDSIKFIYFGVRWGFCFLEKALYLRTVRYIYSQHSLAG